MPTTDQDLPSPAEVRLLRSVRRRLGAPVTVATARSLSAVGEHALGWCALAAVGGLAQPSRRRQWLEAGGLVLAAHAASVVLKRVVRRPRPDLPDCPPLVGTPSRLSFPSSHATSTTAAALLLAPLAGGAPVAVTAAGVVGAMGTSRVLLGVHYPTDVLAGCGLGAVVALVGRRLTGVDRHGR